MGVSGGQEIDETIWFCSKEGQRLPEQYYQECYLKVEEDDPSPVLSTGWTFQVLCLFLLGPVVQNRYRYSE